MSPRHLPAPAISGRPHISSSPATMDTDNDYTRRVPTLVQLCQRAAGAHVEAISSLGDSIAYTLVKPILERCSTEQLSHLEEGSPHLICDTAEIWRDLCFRKYRLTAVERYSVDDDPQEPDSWKSRYFTLQDAEAKRIDELGSRLRIQRMEADVRKNEKKVKYTDRLPDPKRARTGSSWNTPPKTLFQRTRQEASKIHRAYNMRMIPPAPSSNTYRVLPQNAGAAFPPASPSSSRVTVNTVVYRRTSTSSSTAVASRNVSSGSSVKVPISKTPLPPPTDPSKKSLSINRPKSPLPVTSSPLPIRSMSLASSEPQAVRVAKPLSTAKKDPMASLFVPKRTLKPQPRRPI